MFDFIKSLSRSSKRRILLGLDVVLMPFSLFGAIVLLTGTLPTSQWIMEHLDRLLLLTATTAGLSILLGLPRVQLKSYEISSMGRSAVLAMGVAALMAALDGSPGNAINVSLPLVFALLFLVLGTMIRLILLQFLLFLYRRDAPAETRMLIYGAGNTGMQLAMALKSHGSIRPVAFIDDNPMMHNVTVAGLPVHAPTNLEHLIREHAVERVLLAMPSLRAARQAQIARRIARLGVEVHSLPSFAQLVGHEAIIDKLAPMLPGVFLGREQLDAALDGGFDAYRGHSVMVTGAGGSIGSELCRQILNCNPARLVLLEISEYALYSIDRELRILAKDQDCEIVPVLGSVTDAPRVRAAIRANGVQVVLHAAAYKHVPLVEINPEAGIANNVFGTRDVAQAALECGVERFILISSDKAVRPKGLMGASKRLAEIVVGDMARRSRGTRFATVRFGNVLGSSGSVIPLFHEQILSGGPVTLTDENVTRYFMTIEEATRLVLWAGSEAKGGEVFVLDMGEPIRIADLARHVIEAAGHTVRDARNPAGDIEIVTIGLRPGEKLSEELSLAQTLSPTRNAKVLSAVEGCLNEFQIARALQSLHDIIERGDTAKLADEAMHWIQRDLETAEPEPVTDTGRQPKA